jgi:hypothetical protein
MHISFIYIIVFPKDLNQTKKERERQSCGGHAYIEMEHGNSVYRYK